VLEIIQHSTAFLDRKGVDSPRLQSELILAHVMNLPRMKLYLEFQSVVPEAQAQECRTLVQRRGTREPLQHILGTSSFAGLELACGPQALVPRPETELLAEHAVRLLHQTGNPSPRALDFGTGTGCLAILMAVQHAGVEVWAVDISSEALELARANAGRHAVRSRVHFHAGDGFSALPEGLRFDVIVSNPPYIPSAEIGTLEPEVRDHDPRLALDGGEDGLNFHRLVGREAPHWLAVGGALAAEFGDGQAAAITQLWTAENWIVDPVLKDYAGRERFLIARRSE
jgi:release factor glutamine methyltransferase